MKIKITGTFALLMLSLSILTACSKNNTVAAGSTAEATVSTPTVPSTVSTSSVTTAPIETSVPNQTTTPEESTPSATMSSTDTTVPLATEPTAGTVCPTEPPVTTAPVETTEPARKPTEDTVPPATEPSVPVTTTHTHRYTETIVAATCNTKGYTCHVCTCGHSYNDTYTDIDTENHNYMQIVREPTCALSGVTYYECKSCGDRYLDDSTFVAPLKHTKNGDPIRFVPATEDERGYNLYKCAVCGREFMADYVDRLPHQHSYVSTVTAPTCTTDGYTSYVCSGCGDSYKDNYTKAAGHNYESTVTKPTCTEGGRTVYKCAVCGNEYTGDITAAAGHSWGDWVVTAESTYYTFGSQERICTSCGTKDVQSLDKIPMTDEIKQQEVLRLVNIEREKAGVAPLSYYTEAQIAADIRAEELPVLFEHDRPDGTVCFTVFEETGVSIEYPVGENIAWGYSNPQSVVEGWMNSQGHKENILNPDYTRLVVGVYDNYWVQLFVG